jgi:hypothetical protein
VLVGVIFCRHLGDDTNRIRTEMTIDLAVIHLGLSFSQHIHVTVNKLFKVNFRKLHMKLMAECGHNTDRKDRKTIE